MTTATGRPGQLTLDDELARLLEQHALRDRLISSHGAAPMDGACRLLKQLVRRGLSESALPTAAALILPSIRLSGNEHESFADTRRRHR
jgi:hypothetical protein